MPVYQAIVLGIVQGLAEFLPISSSAHLILVPWVLGWDDPGLAFDVALHWGTLFAVLIVFWRDWIQLVSAGLRSLADRQFLGTAERRLFWGLVVATIPGAIVGKLLGDYAEETLRS
ncbi:MAG: undecaprenyl-diphosphate phosphatase, partial [Myxococcales bacterium]